VIPTSAPATCFFPASPLTCQTNSTTCAIPVAPKGCRRTFKPPEGLIGILPPFFFLSMGKLRISRQNKKIEKSIFHL